MGNGVTLSPVGSVPVYGNSPLDPAAQKPSEPVKAKLDGFTGDAQGTIAYNDNALYYTQLLGIGFKADFFECSLNGAYGYPSFAPGDTASEGGYTVKRINTTTYTISGPGLASTQSIASAAEIDALAGLNDSQKGTLKKLFSQVYMSEIGLPAGLKGYLAARFNLDPSNPDVENAIRLRLGVLPQTINSPEIDNGMKKPWQKLPGETLGLELAYLYGGLSASVDLKFSQADPTNPYAAGLDNFKSTLTFGGYLDALGLPNWFALSGITLGSAPEIGNPSGAIVKSSNLQVRAGYDFKDLFGASSDLVVGALFGLDDQRYKNEQKLSNTTNIGLNVQGNIPFVYAENKKDIVFGMNFNASAMYQYLSQYYGADAGVAVTDYGTELAGSHDVAMNFGVGLEWHPIKANPDFVLNLNGGLNPTWGTTSRMQDQLSGAPIKVTEERAWLLNPSISLSVGIKLPPTLAKKADAPVVAPVKSETTDPQASTETK